MFSVVTFGFCSRRGRRRRRRRRRQRSEETAVETTGETTKETTKETAKDLTGQRGTGWDKKGRDGTGQNLRMGQDGTKMGQDGAGQNRTGWDNNGLDGTQRDGKRREGTGKERDGKERKDKRRATRREGEGERQREIREQKEVSQGGTRKLGSKEAKKRLRMCRMCERAHAGWRLVAGFGPPSSHHCAGVRQHGPMTSDLPGLVLGQNVPRCTKPLQEWRDRAVTTPVCLWSTRSFQASKHAAPRGPARFPWDADIDANFIASHDVVVGEFLQKHKDTLNTMGVSLKRIRA